MFNLKIIMIAALVSFSGLAQAQTSPSLEFPNGPTAASLEVDGGPTGKLDSDELKSIQAYAFDAKTSITRLLTKISSMEGDENSIVDMRIKLLTGVQKLIDDSKDKRSILLLTHALQAGMTMVRLIEKQTVELGPEQTPKGTIEQEFNILKQSLVFARDYYESDFQFIDGVLTTQEQKTNPKFVDFGVALTKSILTMSNKIISVRANYGMIRWTLAVLANYIKNDKNVGIAFSSTRYNLVTVLTEKDVDGTPVYPDFVNGETISDNNQLIKKTRELKSLAASSFQEIADAKKALEAKTN